MSDEMSAFGSRVLSMVLVSFSRFSFSAAFKGRGMSAAAAKAAAAMTALFVFLLPDSTLIPRESTMLAGPGDVTWPGGSLCG